MVPLVTTRPGVSMATNCRPASPNHRRLAKLVFLVTEDVPASDANSGSFSHLNSKSVSSDCSNLFPAITLSSVDFPAPVHPMTTMRLRSGSIRVKSSIAEYSTSTSARRNSFR